MGWGWVGLGLGRVRFRSRHCSSLDGLDIFRED